VERDSDDGFLRVLKRMLSCLGGRGADLDLQRRLKALQALIIGGPRPCLGPRTPLLLAQGPPWAPGPREGPESWAPRWYLSYHHMTPIRELRGCCGVKHATPKVSGGVGVCVGMGSGLDVPLQGATSEVAPRLAHSQGHWGSRDETLQDSPSVPSERIRTKHGPRATARPRPGPEEICYRPGPEQAWAEGGGLAGRAVQGA